ncbi:spore germination protein [Metabacillus halosaccharovorans]|uniref:Spore germination protein n=1 Tax=Metabacillus halosaccharovorans TaxID=930124 RepID=A0ABT3DEK7_9BACI|nr:spore germination protein [Metabacillus halosaccharovorans]MCV9885377.1 spore germination protein [Metabacillus halosaccharovorans]
MKSRFQLSRKKWENIKYTQQLPHDQLEAHKDEVIDKSLQVNSNWFKQILGDNDDFVTRKFMIFGLYPAALFYLSDFADQQSLNQDILKPLMSVPTHLLGKNIERDTLQDTLMNEVLYHSKVVINNKKVELVQSILQGETIIIIDGVQEAFQIGTRKVEKRAINQPETEQVILGPREGFIETLSTNISLLRYRLQTPDFIVKTLNVGEMTKSKVAICFVRGLAGKELIKEVEDRLSKIDIDGILDVGYIEQFIEDNHMSPFPQVQSTERPDKTVGGILEGRVAIMVDGSPFALLVPVVFNQFYQTAEDYSSRYLMGSFVRIARILALVFSLIFPSIYVSFISFNPELLPTEFAVAVAGGRAGVPFPAVIEVLLIEVAMEVLREATVRLPKQVGGALSIVGVLVIGQAAVEAGIASPITVVVIAMTTIGSFATPAYSAAFALRMLRFPIVILAGVFGLYGVVVGVILIFNHMLSLKSFGVPYMSPVSPFNIEGMKDVVIRGPLWWMPKRPGFLHTKNDIRVRKNSKQNSTTDSEKAGNHRRKGDEDGTS